MVTILFLALPALPPSLASPFVQAGDTVLRHDIQRLADLGIITGPTSTWPLAWGPILWEIRNYEVTQDSPPDVADAISRILARGSWETRADEFYFNAGASAVEKPTRIRTFENTPRERAELSAGFTYTGDWFTVSVNGQAVDSPADGEEFRADGSVIGAALGNYSLTVNTMERWWGPGWDGSLILSNNARPMPAISLDRNYTDAFETKWLSWLGTWDLSVHFAQLEHDRVVPDAQFFGLRFNFKPHPSLEIGLSRTAQWCGEGRPCNFDTFIDLFLGRDNRGDDDIDDSNEPGNQLAGVDVRWATSLFKIPMAFYGQFIGEDEAGGLPSRYMGQLGVDGTGLWRDRWSYRWFGEFAGTSCQFHESSELFNCAYNHGIYRTGYRYRGRSIGHGADNDARVLSFGLTMTNENRTEWAGLLRYAKLNRDGPADGRNTLTPTPQDVVSADLRHVRSFRYGVVSLGLGVEFVDDEASDSTDTDVRAFLEWRSSY